MTSVVFYFQVHQPYRLQRYTYFDIGAKADYFDDELNAMIARRVAERCYLPMNRLLLELIDRTDGRFRCAFSVSGTALRQLEAWAPEALESFQALAGSGAVEFLGETSHHSLAAIADMDEFRAQVEDQRARVRALFGQEPVTFRNTELVFDEAIAREVARLGFSALLGEGAERLLGERSAHFPYRVRGVQGLALLLRDYVRSDDIAFRFSNRTWDRYPLMADTFASWLHAVPSSDPFIGLFMDYETFGEHQWAETGILDFMECLPEFVLAREGFDFRTPRELAWAEPARLGAAPELDVPDPISWADLERDLSAWLANPMQKAAHEALYALGPAVRAAAAAGRPELLETWRRLSTSDHVYYMSTKHYSDGDVHEYFSPYDSPHQAFITYMNVIDDFSRRVAKLPRAQRS